ncbi:hypothetical protein, partial [Escherichia coli]|uniref:hypothetical protein n=1 Tax=Escherichia coli TaxID=562 RepID=UPI0032DB821A
MLIQNTHFPKEIKYRIYFTHVHYSKLGIAFANQSLSSTNVLSFPHFKPNIVLDVHTKHNVGKLE